jgi:integrase
MFIRVRASYRGFASGSSLYTPIRRRLDAAGVQTVGKRGPLAFRHARAVSLLRSGVPPKVIGDVPVHRSATSTTPYLIQTARTLERAWPRLDPTVELPPPDRGLERCVEQQQRRDAGLLAWLESL